MSRHTRSVYSDDEYSTTSSQYTVTYADIPKKKSKRVGFMKWAAGCPPNASAVKKKQRDFADDGSMHSYSSSGSYFGDYDTRLYWVTYPEDRYYSSRSSSGRSSRSGGRSRKSKPRPPPIPGAIPANMAPPPAMGPPGGGFVPPPPDHMGGGGMYGVPPPTGPPPMMGGMPPVGMPPAGPPPGGDTGFINLTGQGQHQRGNPFNGGGHHGPAADDEWSETGSDYSDGSGYSSHH